MKHLEDKHPNSQHLADVKQAKANINDVGMEKGLLDYTNSSSSTHFIHSYNICFSSSQSQFGTEEPTLNKTLHLVYTEMTMGC